MPLTFYNTLTRTKEEFTPLTPGEVKLYTCGPTVYGFAHIGNFRAYIFEDLLRRFLEYKGYQVTHVQNLTDVDDKTIRQSCQECLTLNEFTDKYVKAFFADGKTLNLLPAHIYPAATGHIPEMIDLVSELKAKGFTYESEGSTYFRISSFPDYGKLSGVDACALQAGARVDNDEYEKEEARDFVLWKAWREEDGEVCWDSPHGKGRPGWHLECSAMSMKYLGETLDIHCGGEDNIFPHHENEIAQSEAATGKKFVNYWLHCGYLLVEGRKMSKSLGNFYTLQDLFDKGFKPSAVRYLLLSTHYRQQLNFTLEGLEAATNAIQRLQDFILALREIKDEGNCSDAEKILTDARAGFELSLEDDLNIAPALGAVFTLVKEINKIIAAGEMTVSAAEKILDFLKSVDTVIGVLDFSEPESDAEIDRLIEQRLQARKDRDYKTADEIREKLTSMGIILEDTPGGTRWKRQ